MSFAILDSGSLLNSRLCPDYDVCNKTYSKSGGGSRVSGVDSSVYKILDGK